MERSFRDGHSLMRRATEHEKKAPHEQGLGGGADNTRVLLGGENKTRLSHQHDRFRIVPTVLERKKPARERMRASELPTWAAANARSPSLFGIGLPGYCL